MQLTVVNENQISEAERAEINTQIDSIIERHKNNRYEINKLVFESVAALTESGNYSSELSSQGAIKRFWGGITGKNNKLRNKIDSSLATAQYASQRTLQKLAEQNLMSFELIAAVNNKLNASLVSIENEINTIYGTLVTFFKQAKSDIIQLENRVERLERNVNLLNWQNSIEYQMWNGIEYTELDDVSKIVCLTRDFYDITGGQYTTSDLLLLKTALVSIGLNAKVLINLGEFIHSIYNNKQLCDKLFDGTLTNEYLEPSIIAISSEINKGNLLSSTDGYIVGNIQKYLQKYNLNKNKTEIIADLVNEYTQKELHINNNVHVSSYDLILELLYNIEQLKYEPPISNELVQKEKIKKAEEYYLLGEHEQAFQIFYELASEYNNGRSMYFIGEYYRFGYGMVDILDKDKGFEWHKKGAILGEPLCKLNTMYLYDENSPERENIKREVYDVLKDLSESGDVIVQNEFADICDNEEEKKKWLEEAAKKGHWSSMHKLGVNYYGKNKTEYDYFRAINYFMEAKKRHYANSIGYLGLMYDWGYGFKEDKKEAFDWFEIAAKNGSVFSMRNLANCYYNGNGCAKNLEESKKWYKRAAELGNEAAKVQLKEKFGIEI